jgi:hypothetical protein
MEISPERNSNPAAQPQPQPLPQPQQQPQSDFAMTVHAVVKQLIDPLAASINALRVDFDALRDTTATKVHDQEIAMEEMRTKYEAEIAAINSRLDALVKKVDMDMSMQSKGSPMQPGSMDLAADAYKRVFELQLPFEIPPEHSGRLLVEHVTATLRNILQVNGLEVVSAEQWTTVGRHGRGSRTCITFTMADMPMASSIRNLRQQLGGTGFTIKDVLTAQEHAEYQKVEPVYRKARQDRKHARFYRSQLYINGKLYTGEDSEQADTGSSATAAQPATYAAAARQAAPGTAPAAAPAAAAPAGPAAAPVGPPAAVRAAPAGTGRHPTTARTLPQHMPRQSSAFAAADRTPPGHRRMWQEQRIAWHNGTSVPTGQYTSRFEPMPMQQHWA